MLELDKVFADYLPNSEQIVAGVKTRRKLKSRNDLPVDFVITKDLPQLFEQIVTSTGRDVEKYRIYGSVGQVNWTLAYIPWVAILRRDITTSTERGYYVVLLFSQDMQIAFSRSTRASRSSGRRLATRLATGRSRKSQAWLINSCSSPRTSLRDRSLYLPPRRSGKGMKVVR